MHHTEILVRRNNHFGIDVFPNMNKWLHSRNTQRLPSAQARADPRPYPSILQGFVADEAIKHVLGDA